MPQVRPVPAVPAAPTPPPAGPRRAARGGGGRLALRLRRFRRDCAGTIAVETIVVMPMLMFALVVCVGLADMFRSQTTALRAAYAVGDTLARRVDPVNGAYLDGTAVLYRYLANARHGTWLRVSSIAFSAAQNRYIVIWSHHANGGEALTTERLNEGLHLRLPTLPVGETVILVEAGTQWRSVLSRWFPDREFRQVVVTRPRFTSQLRYDDGSIIIFLPGGGGTCDDGATLCGPGS